MAVDTVTIAASPRAHPHEVGVARRLLLSLAATVLGWLVVTVSWLGVIGEWSDGARALGVMLAIGQIVGPTWLLAVVPLALSQPPESPLLRRGWAALFGAVCGVLLVCVVIVGFGRPPTNVWVAAIVGSHAAVCGAVTWQTYAFLLRWQSRVP